jgi:hypothetical protein
VTCGLTPYTYARASKLKYDVARYQLSQFEGALPVVPWAALIFRMNQLPGLSPVLAHSDGCVLQLYAAFDAFACAVAHRLTLLPRDDRASFKGLRGPGIALDSAELADLIGAVLDAPEFEQLEDLRNLAAHRGLIAGSVRSASPTGMGVEVYLERGAAKKDGETDVLQLLGGTVEWAKEPLRWLWEFAEAWLEPGEHSIKGTVGDLDSGEPIS